jgi:hypothetical protein
MRATPVSTLARSWILPIVALLGIAALAGACGGGGGTTTDATLTDPRSVPTATPWSEETPDPIFLEEGSVTPISGGERTGGSGETYIVQPGDSPYAICLKFDCDYNDLLELNGITDPTTLHVGQELKIP